MNDRFRVWDKSEECYVDPDDCELFFIEPNGEITIGVYYGDIEETRFCKQENLCVEQCTGLKDKNGRLIYEGDIVLLDDKDSFENPIKTVVRWAEENASFGLFRSHNLYYGFSYYESKNFEVIGNIHENPELLEEGK